MIDPKWRTTEAHLMTQLLDNIHRMELAEEELCRIEAVIREQVNQEMGGRNTLGARAKDLYRKAYHTDEDWKVTLDNIRACERRAAMLGPAARAVQEHMRGLSSSE